MPVLTREVNWPGNQINDINQFRENCYRECHLQNPTDSGWYEKSDECGQNCKELLKAYEYIQGKNPCELRLQAPVFWFENFELPLKEDDDKGKSNTTTTDILYLVLFLVIIFLIAVYILVYMLDQQHVRRYPGSSRSRSTSRSTSTGNRRRR